MYTGWNSSVNGTVWGTPLIIQTRSSGEIAVIGSINGSVYAFHTKDGSLKWRLQTGGSIFVSVVTVDPADVSAGLWVGSYDTNMYKVNRDTGTVTAQVSLGTEVRTTPAIITVPSTTSHAVSHAVSHAMSPAKSPTERLYLSVRRKKVYKPMLVKDVTERLYLSVGGNHVCIESGGAEPGAEGSKPPFIKWTKKTTGFAFSSPSVSSSSSSSSSGLVRTLHTPALTFKRVSFLEQMSGYRKGEKRQVYLRLCF